MNQTLKHKIDKIVERAVGSPWKHRFIHPDLDKSLIFYVVAKYLLIAKNGKQYIASSYASNIIDQEQQTNQTHAQLKNLKYHKMCNAKKVLTTLIQRQLEKRTGLLTHKGYFKFVDIKAYNGD